MSDDSGIDNGRINGVEDNHEIPTEVTTRKTREAVNARQLLSDIGFNTESIGNKIALPIDGATRDKIASDPTLKRAFIDAGGGLNTHDSQSRTDPNHKGFNDFVIKALSDIYRSSVMILGTGT